MKFRSIFPLMLLATLSSLTGQDVDSLMRKGEDALASGLWEMAALHFDECLTSGKLSAAEKSQVAIRLAESWVRDGRPQDALDLLAKSFVAPHPEATFWQGQALLGLGRFAEAAETLSPLLADPAAPLRGEAGFTLANLQTALGHPEKALDALSLLANPADAALSSKARLQMLEILLDLGRTAEARTAMPDAGSISPADGMLAKFLEAQLLLREGRPADAVSSFQTLVDQPQGQSIRRYHAAAVGLADSMIARGTPETALAFLIAFIQKNPDSPQIEAMFQRLLDGLPDKPTANDPILERIAQWITPAEIPEAITLAAVDSSIAPAWSLASTTSELLAYSLFTRAVGLHRMGTPDSRAEAARLLTRLRVENPSHVLVSRALFQTARWALNIGSNERAFAILDTLRETTGTAAMQGEAAFLEAQSAFAKGDKNQAIKLFDEAAKSLAANESKTARLNAAIVGLSGGSTTLIQATSPDDPALSADLELERALCTTKPAERRQAIVDFLTKHPEHPRAAEAHMTAAEAALVGPNPDLPFARAQLDSLTADPEKSANLSPARMALLSLRIQDQAKDSATAITTARSILENHAGDPAAAEAALVLGRNLFQTRNYNDARLVLEKLAATDTDPGRAQAAWLLAARSAALVPTSQSQQEALRLFEKVSEAKSPLSALANLEKARLMIDMNRLAEAVVFLRKWFESLAATDPLHLPAGLLLGEAIYAQGSIHPDSLTEALSVYDKLSVHTEKHPAVFNRLQYRRGLTLEQIPDEKNPSQKRKKQAFTAYYSALETTTPPVEWEYFELCGFKALELLEKAERWPAAIACAKKIASFKGPGAEKAATRASQLQLKHMIWED